MGDRRFLLRVEVFEKWIRAFLHGLFYTKKPPEAFGSRGLILFLAAGAYLPRRRFKARIFLRCFLRLCVLILCLWRFLPDPM